mmetsp:Transcript_45080/g.119630  ORF Transcript_45080/g.119630 Transcript_45080/m.119630 type:complete len:306 (-) Transcript_45080:970-1887(-)
MTEHDLLHLGVPCLAAPHLHHKAIADSELVLELTRGAHGLHGAQRQHALAVRQEIRFLQVVRGKHDAPTRQLHLDKKVPKLAPGCRIHAAGRFVEEDDGRLADKGGGDPESALLSTREGSAEVVHLFTETKRRENRGDAFPDAALGHTPQAGEVDEVLTHSELGVHRIVLRADAHLPPRCIHVCPDVKAVDARSPRGDRNDADEAIDGRGFSSSVVAQHREDLTAVHLETQVVHRHFILELFVQSLNGYGHCVIPSFRVCEVTHRLALRANVQRVQAEAQRLGTAELSLPDAVEPPRKKEEQSSG